MSTNYIKESEPSIHVRDVVARKLFFRGRPPIPWRGIIDEKRFSFDILHRHKSPESAVLTEISVIAHREQMVLWHLDRTVIVSRTIGPRDDHFGQSSCLGNHHFLVIDKNMLVANFDSISSDSNHALDEVLGAILRENKYNDISRLGLFAMRPSRCP